MHIFTRQWLDDKAREVLAAQDAEASVNEWFIVCEGSYTWLLVIVYKKPGVKGVYTLQYRLAKP